jgi:hypothetical protein
MKKNLWILFLGISNFTSSSAVIFSPIGGQLHSYNDLRSWPQAISKSFASTFGSAKVAGLNETLIMLKIDPQWVDADSCKTFIRARKGDTRGCLLLNHDTISPTKARLTMNTTDDLAPLLLSDALSPFVKQSSTTMVAISLCFKGCGGSGCPCNSGTDKNTANWLSLVDELYSTLNSVIDNNNLNVRILLDGSGNPASSSCLYQRWRPWESVYITGDDPSDGFTSNDPSKGYDRLTVLNEEVSTFPLAAGLGFGKFAGGGGNSSNYTTCPRPYICWEPSDASGISNIVSDFIKSPGIPNPAGLRFAINIDAAQLDVHAAYSLTQTTTNAFTPFANAWFESSFDGNGVDSTPIVFSLPNSQRLFISWIDRILNTILWKCLTYSIPGKAFESCGSGLLPLIVIPTQENRFWSLDTLLLQNGSTVLISTTAQRSTDQGFVLLSGFLEEALIVEFDGTSLDFISMSTPSPPPSSAPNSGIPGSDGIILASLLSPFSVSISSCGPGSESGSESILDACRVWAWAPGKSDTSNCILSGAIFGGSNSSTFSSSNTTCWAISPNNSFFGIITASLVDSLSIGISPFTIPGSIDSRVAVIASYSASGLVFGLTACALDSSSGGSFGLNDLACFNGNNGIVGENSTQNSLVSHVGSMSSISLLSTGPHAISVFEMHSNSSCPNNEIDNKREDIGLCDQLPVRNSGMPYLAYSYGDAFEWALQLLNAEFLSTPSGSISTDWPGSSICSSTIAHGSVGTGEYPSVALVSSGSGSGSGSNINVAIVLQGVTSTSDPLNCGVSSAPTPDESPLRIIGWSLAQSYITREGGMKALT